MYKLQCGDLSPLFNAKLAEQDFRGLENFVDANARPILEKGARLSKLRPGKAVTSHTQSTGFATPCFPFISWARFSFDRSERTRTKIGISNHSCKGALKSFLVTLGGTPMFRLAARRTTHDSGAALSGIAAGEAPIFGGEGGASVRRTGMMQNRKTSQIAAAADQEPAAVDL